jgi:hypothetical protein
LSANPPPTNPNLIKPLIEMKNLFHPYGSSGPTPQKRGSNTPTFPVLTAHFPTLETNN